MSKESKPIATGTERDSKQLSNARDAGVYIWPILSSMYGHKFTSQFGEALDSTWIACLKGLNELQVKKGLEACLQEYPVWPPGAAQYRALCEGRILDKDGNDSSWQHAGDAYKSFDDPSHPSYEPKRIDSDEQKEKRNKKAKTELGKLKSILGVRK